MKLTMTIVNIICAVILVIFVGINLLPVINYVMGIDIALTAGGMLVVSIIFLILSIIQDYLLQRV